MNKNRDRPILFNTGLTPAYLISSDALYANSNQGVYYSDQSQFNKWLLLTQAGFQFTLTDKKHFNIGAGPEVRYGLNNMSGTATAPHQHLLSAGINLRVNLK